MAGLMHDHAVPAVTVDTLLYVLTNTLLSPFFAAGITLLTYGLGQRAGQQGIPSGVHASLVYLGICWTLWFLPWSSKIWENKSWRQGLRGLMGMARIDWSDQVVVITGGSQGLGKCMVDILDVKKVTVVVLDKRVPPASDEYNDVHFYQCDVSNFDEVKAIGKKIKEKHGAPTILVNNAGFVAGKTIFDLSEREIRTTFEVNTIAHFWTVKTFLPDMLKSGKGHVMNIASLLGNVGVHSMTDYCASKHAVLGFHEALKAELQQFDPASNVKLSVVLPGHIRTTLFSGIKPFNSLASFLLPLQEPHEIAKAAIDKLERGEAGMLCMPKLVGISWLWRGLPSWASDGLRSISEADSAMIGFSERKSESVSPTEDKKDI